MQACVSWHSVVVAATQMSCSNIWEDNVSRAEKLVRLSHENGAHVILLQVNNYRGVVFFLNQNIPIQASRELIYIFPT